MFLVHGAIDGTHIHTTKPKTPFLEDYYHFITFG